tara:strand:+ start:298 stop:792 length:495 start_codon:yes stop_codon:yes gene_type:complete
MVITYQTVSKVKFPVYILGSSDWQESDGLLFLENKLLDDRNMSGDNLGLRRLQTPFKDLYPLKAHIGSLLGLIKQDKSTFIDTNGVPFLYEKTKFSSLKYYKIRKIEQKNTSSVLWLKGINFPFKIPRPPQNDLSWAGVLHQNNIPWMLYEYSAEKQADTRRKV